MRKRTLHSFGFANGVALTTLVAGSLGSLFVACGSSNKEPATEFADAGDKGTDGAVPLYVEDASQFGDAHVPPMDAGDGGGVLIYGSSDTSLYSLDPRTNAVRDLGQFDCVPSGTTVMTDIAVNAKDEIWGVSAAAVWRMELSNDGGADGGTSVHCAQKVSIQSANQGMDGGATASRFYALSFAPKGIISPNEEVLVAGNTQGELWAIDANGALSQHGTFGTIPKDDGRGHSYDYGDGGKPWELSGDIVFLGGATPVGFATVRDCPNPPDTYGCNRIDTLVELDLDAMKNVGTQSVVKSVRGLMAQANGCGNGGSYGRFYGVAAWGSKVYGFSRYGSLVVVDNATGEGCSLPSPPNVSWSGAGVTTLAPVIAPPPR